MVLRPRRFFDPSSFHNADVSPPLPHKLVSSSPTSTATATAIAESLPSPKIKPQDSENLLWHTQHLQFMPLVTSFILASALLMCLACCWTMDKHWSRATKTFIGREWWPTISSVIGDNMPERAIFRIAGALVSGPKLLQILMLFSIFGHQALPSDKHQTARRMARVVAPISFGISIFRCVSCGMWIFIGSGEHLNLHQIAFAIYAVLSVFEKIVLVVQTRIALIGQRNAETRTRWRWSLIMKSVFLILYIVCLLSGLPFLFQHTVHKTMGAYSIYAITEWLAALFELSFDATAAFESCGVVLSMSSCSPHSHISNMTLHERTATHHPMSPINPEFDGEENGNGSGNGMTSSKSGRKKNQFTTQIQQRATSILHPIFRHPMMGFLTNIMRSVVFWSLASALPMAAFFSPMVAMHFTGGEIAMFAPLSGILCCIFSPKSKSKSKLRTVSLIVESIAQIMGFISFELENHTMRISVLGMSVGVCFFFTIRDLFFCECDEDEDGNDLKSSGLILGLIVFVSLRMAFLSRDPFLVHGRISILMCLMVLLSGHLSNIHSIKHRPQHQQHIHATRSDQHQHRHQQLVIAMIGGSGFGGAISLMGWLFSSHGVISRWSGVDPFPWGCCVPLSILSGLIFSTTFTRSKRSMIHCCVWFLCGGVICGTLLTSSEKFSSGVAFFGGCGLAIWLTSEWRGIMEEIWKMEWREKVVAVTIGLMMNCVNPIVTAYVVAYPFVPGGFILRERPHWILLTLVSIVGLSSIVSTFTNNNNNNKKNTMRIDDDDDQQEHDNVITITNSHNKKSRSPISDDDDDRDAKPQRHEWSNVQLLRIGVVIVLVIVIFPSILMRLIREPHHHHHSLQTQSSNEVSRFSAMIWAIHFGYDNNGGDSFEKIAEKIRFAKADVVGLLESDLNRVFIGNRDIVEYLGSELGMFSDYGPSTNNNTWGCALLSVHPILRSERVVLPSPEGELACLIDARILVGSTEVQVIVTHFGNTQHVKDLQLQTDALQRIISEADASSNDSHASCVLGYLTMNPYSDRYMQIVQVVSPPAAAAAPSSSSDPMNNNDNDKGDRQGAVAMDRGKLQDSAPEVLTRYCEYILFKRFRLERFRKLDVGEISDTEIQLAEFELMKK